MPNKSGYDIIGDIHGERATLEALLEKLGYCKGDSGWAPPAGRQAIFVGDYIDRGPDSRGVCRLVREMVESGHALAVLGNHEINALAFHTRDPNHPNEYLRPHKAKYIGQHQATLDSFSGHDSELADALEWFMTLPMWLELDGLRVIHAAWHQDSIETLKRVLEADHTLTEQSLFAVHESDSDARDAMEKVLKGIELYLPDDLTFTDKDGNVRRKARIRWWLDDLNRPWPDIVLVSDALREQLPVTNADFSLGYGYDASQPPVFFGHYWLRGTPKPLKPNAACLDYSVAYDDGELVSYRWNGEQVLKTKNFVSVKN